MMPVRPTLHATCIRFDIDAWEAITRHARRLGIPRAQVIRAATAAELIRRDERDRQNHATLGADIEALHERVRRLERAIVGRALPHTAPSDRPARRTPS
jgi:hypothetical protein